MNNPHGISTAAVRQRIATASQLGDWEAVGVGELLLGKLIIEEYGNRDEARQHLSNALKTFQALNIPHRAAEAYVALGWLHRECFKDLATAEACLVEALEIARKLQDFESAAQAMSELSFVAQDKNEYESAFRFAEQVLEIRTRLGAINNILDAKYRSGQLAIETKRYDLAEALLGECQQYAEQLIDRSWLSDILLQLSRLALRKGELARAVQLTRQYLPIRRAIEGPYQAVMFLLTFAIAVDAIASRGVSMALAEECLFEFENGSLQHDQGNPCAAAAALYLWALAVDTSDLLKARQYLPLVYSYTNKMIENKRGKDVGAVAALFMFLFHERTKLIFARADAFERARALLIMAMGGALFTDPHRHEYVKQIAGELNEIIEVFRAAGDKYREGLVTTILQEQFNANQWA